MIINKFLNWLNKIYKKPEEKESLEDYYNNKYPKIDIVYNGRPIPKKDKVIGIDIRNFYNLNDSILKKISYNVLTNTNLTDDEKAYLCLKWVKNNIKYISDNKKGYNEYWQFPYETIYYLTGDCEDGAILMANMMNIIGIPDWKIRLTAGNTPIGGHAYVVYFCEEQKEWKTLDWCYYPNDLKINERPTYKDDKLYKNVWFSWNSKYCFSEGLNKQAKEILNGS